MSDTLNDFLNQEDFNLDSDYDSQHNVKRVWFNLNSTGLNDNYSQAGHRCRVIGEVQSIVLCEDLSEVQQDYNPQWLELSPDDFWPYLFSDSWSVHCCLRVMRGELLDLLMAKLLVMERDRVIRTHENFAFRTLPGRTTHLGDGCPETLMVNFTYFGKCKPILPPIVEHTKVKTRKVRSARMVEQPLPSPQPTASLPVDPNLTIPDGFLCREPRSVRGADKDIDTVDSGILGFTGPIRVINMPKLVKLSPDDPAVAAAICAFQSEVADIMLQRSPSLSKVSSERLSDSHRKEKKVDDGARRQALIKWNLDKYQYVRKPPCAGYNLKLTSNAEEGFVNADTQLRERHAIIKSMRQELWDLLDSKSNGVKKYKIQESEPVKEVLRTDLVQTFTRCPSFMEYMLMLQGGKKGTGTNPSFMTPKQEDHCSNRGSKKYKSSSKWKDNLETYESAAQKKRRKRNEKMKKMWQERQMRGSKRYSNALVIDQRFAEEVGGITDSVGVKNQLLKAATFCTVGRLKFSQPLNDAYWSISFLDETDDESGRTKESKKTINEKERPTVTFASNSGTAEFVSNFDTSKLNRSYSEELICKKVNDQVNKPVYEKILRKYGKVRDTLSRNRKSACYSGDLSNVSTTISLLQVTSTYTVQTSPSSRANSPSTHTLPPVAPSVINSSPTNSIGAEDEFVLGKLKWMKCLDYKGHQPKLPKLKLPNFNARRLCRSDFSDNFSKALDEFVIRKESVLSDYSTKSLMTITFTRPQMFGRPVHADCIAN